MNAIRNKGCFSSASRALLAFEFLRLRLLFFLPLLILAACGFFIWKKKKKEKEGI